jgi:hypothetical protein
MGVRSDCSVSTFHPGAWLPQPFRPMGQRRTTLLCLLHDADTSGGGGRGRKDKGLVNEGPFTQTRF